MPNDASINSDSEPAVELRVDGMHCAGCVGKVERALTSLESVRSATVILADERATVRGTRLDGSVLVDAIRSAGFDATPIDPMDDPLAAQRELEERHRIAREGWRRRAIIGLAAWAPLEASHWIGPRIFGHGWHSPVIEWAYAIVATVVLAVVGSAFARSAWRAARARTTNMDTLVVVGAGSAWLLSTVELVLRTFTSISVAPLYFVECIGLLAFISLGHWLEARTTARTGAALRGLLELQPETCERLDGADDAEGVVTATARVSTGALIAVRPGERVPIDGEVVRGRSSIDESVVTGEPIPRTIESGDAVVAGVIALDGRIVVRTTVVGSETTLVRIARIVRDAQTRKSALQRFADAIAARFVPVVIAIALVTAIAHAVVAVFLADPALRAERLVAGIVAAVTVLVISCPCALGLATPTAIMAALGRATRGGILVRSAPALERAAGVRHAILDKTGTLTQGRPTVGAAVEDETLALAASLARTSSHPLARAVAAEASARGLSIPEATDVREEPGVGLRGRIDDDEIGFVSSRAAAESDAEGVRRADADHTASVVMRSGRVVGVVAFDDPVRADAAELIAELRARGVRPWLVTGDRDAVARRIGGLLGFDEDAIESERRPDEKLAVLERLAREGGVAAVGDGINDAAMLAAAGARGADDDGRDHRGRAGDGGFVPGVGIAIGSGTAIAIESADVVIPGNDLGAITRFLDLARRTRRTIRQNLGLSLVYNSCAIPAAALGLLGTHGPLIAAAAMALSSVSVVANSLRLSRA